MEEKNRSQNSQSPPSTNSQSMELSEIRYTRLQSFSGPLPPPEILEKYKDIEPGIAKEIVEQFVKQGEHRRFLEKFSVTSKVARNFLGMSLAFSLIIFLFYFSADLIKSGNSIEGSIFGVLVIIFLTFISSLEKNQKTK